MESPMFCGLDFGTSNCSVGIVDSGKTDPVLVPIEDDGPYMPSVAWVGRREYAPRQVNPNALNERVAAARKEENKKRSAARRRGELYQGPTDAQVEARERRLLEQQAVVEAEEKYAGQTLIDALEGSQGALVGNQAIRQNMSAPGEGFYFKSPKLFLGSNIDPRYESVFEQIISRMIAEVRSRAERNLDTSLTGAVIGHPVVYSSVSGDAGNKRAIELMRRAARAAGFSDIAFLPEPLAAALNYEARTTAEETLLVVDIGGGTTDCAVVSVGPGRFGQRDRSRDVLSYAGDRVGGVDMDFHLAWHAVMPWFGKGVLRENGLPVPHSPLIDAISVSNFPAQERFRKSEPDLRVLMNEAREPEKLRRLVDLCRLSLQYRLMRSVEQAKIALAGTERVNVPLGYIAPGLDIAVSQGDLMASIEGDL
ncbi:MAG TPA: Hsp70 family protein, partial [Burkholderiales bacterium]|nr:Hsp70 family protein [Burkholderiales bacterium]